MHFLMNFTRFGRAVYAVGGNMEAARLSGIDIWWVKSMALGLTGADRDLAARSSPRRSDPAPAPRRPASSST